jgi:hypothetical protein
MDSFDCVKLPLPKYLKIFTNAGMPVPKAMEISGKLFVALSTGKSRLSYLSHKLGFLVLDIRRTIRLELSRT